MDAEEHVLSQHRFSQPDLEGDIETLLLRMFRQPVQLLPQDLMVRFDEVRVLSRRPRHSIGAPSIQKLPRFVSA